MPLIFRTHRCQDMFSIRQMVIKTLCAQPYIINVTALQSYINPYRSLLQRRTAGVRSLFINTLGNKTRRKTASQGDIKCNFGQTIWLTKYFFSCLIIYVSNAFWHFCESFCLPLPSCTHKETLLEPYLVTNPVTWFTVISWKEVMLWHVQLLLFP